MEKSTTESARSRRKRKWSCSEQSVPECPNLESEVTINTEEAVHEESESDVEKPILTSTSAQCTILMDADAPYDIESYQTKPKALQYYTGFDSYEHFMLFFSILGPAAHELRYKPEGINPQNQLFLTLMKLRQAKDNEELSLMFKVKEGVVSKIVTTWLNFLYFQLKEIDFWPSRDIVQSTMPKGFKKDFASTRVILDATEIPIQKPGRVDDQSLTFSSYKNRNTLKTIIGCTPRGLVSYVSSTYGGSTSDRQIIERSELLNDPSKFLPGDSIMADRGLLVQDLFATRNVKVNTPAMLNGKSQLEPEVVVRDRRIASKRIHVERVIGFGKTYKILKKELSCYKVPLGHRIVFVCFALSNFRRSIVNRLA